MARTANAVCGNTGNNIGSVQADAFLIHNHSVSDLGHTHTVDPANTAVSDPGHAHSVNTCGTAVGQNCQSTTSGINSGGAYGPTFGYINSPTIANSTTGISATVDISGFGSAASGTGISASVDIPSTGSSSSTTGITIQNNGGNETRPENANVYYIIKY